MTRLSHHPSPVTYSAIAIACLSILLAFSAPVRASVSGQQSPITVDSTTVVHTFGGQMIFVIAAHAPTDIVEISLLMRVGADARTDVLQPPFTPDELVEVQAVRDLQFAPIAPFAEVYYSWQLTDSEGNTLTTPEQTHFYEDNRFAWESAPRGAVTAHWHTGDLAFGQAVADIGFDALSRVSRLMNTAPPDHLDIYVYENVNDLQAGLLLGGRAWVGGHADPALGVVMVYAAPNEFELARLENDLAHELAHVITYHVVGPGYTDLPVWLDEGIATNSELQPNPLYADALSTAAKAESLIPLESLCSAFSIDSQRALQSYAQSASVVSYIQDRWGPATIHELLDAYRDGASCQGGVQRVLHLSLAELQADWEQEVLRASPYTNVWRQLSGYIIFALIAFVLFMFLLFVPKRKAAMSH